MAPVGRLATFRVLVAECARRGMEIDFVDIKSAYLQAELDVKLYMTPPAGVKPPKPGMVMRLDRALYGTKQAGRCWNKKFIGNLVDWGFTPSSADPCLFTKRDGEGARCCSRVCRCDACLTTPTTRAPGLPRVRAHGVRTAAATVRPRMTRCKGACFPLNHC